MPSHSNFCTPIIENLNFHGYKVTFIDASPEFKNKIKVSLWHKIIHVIQNVVFNNPNYKNDLKEKIKDQSIQQQIEHIPTLDDDDWVLVIRPDLVTRERLEQLRKKTAKHYIGYQWNGLQRFPQTLSRIQLFDRFFAFDHTDLIHPEFKAYNLMGTTNFYFDLIEPSPLLVDSPVAYFVGLHFDERIKPLEQCAALLLEHGLRLDFNIRILKHVEETKKKYHQSAIQFIDKNIEFAENIEYINRATVLVDILNPIHQGLSFRTFEALQFQKKLITSNPHIQSYDFYHPDNIFIWEPNNLPNLKDFLARPYSQIDQNIVKKYCFHNWLKNILDIAPYQKIVLPD